MNVLAFRQLGSQRPVVERVDIVLPSPPSLNNLFFNNPAGGRGKSRQYREWIEESGWRLLAQHPGCIVGKYAIYMWIARSRKDLGNAGEKAIQDLLTRHHVIDDDSLAERICMSWSDEDNGVRVIVTKWEGT